MKSGKQLGESFYFLKAYKEIVENNYSLVKFILHLDRFLLKDCFL